MMIVSHVINLAGLTAQDHVDIKRPVEAQRRMCGLKCSKIVAAIYRHNVERRSGTPYCITTSTGFPGARDVE